MAKSIIKHVRALVARGDSGADYHDKQGYHWIDDHIATPMARYPEYRESRRSFGINVLGTLVVEIEADTGEVGFAVTTAGEIGAFIVEKHLARFLEGRPVTEHRKDLGPDVFGDDLSTAATASCSTRFPPSISRCGTCWARSGRSR